MTLGDFYRLEFLNEDASHPEALEYLDLTPVSMDETSEEEGSILEIEEIDLEMFEREQRRMGGSDLEDSTDGILEIKDIGMLHSTLEMPSRRSNAVSSACMYSPNVVSNGVCLFDGFRRTVLLSDQSSKWRTSKKCCPRRYDDGSTGRLSTF